jgi:hypothetical protein
VMSNCVEHVIVVDAVLSCCWLDVHDNRLRPVEASRQHLLTGDLDAASTTAARCSRSSTLS